MASHPPRPGAPRPDRRLAVTAGRLAGCLLLLAVPAASAAPPPAAPTRMQKLAAILALEDRRSLGSGELDRHLRDPDRSVRRRAALAAGRIGDPTLVPTLVELMNDAEPEVRQMSAFALGLVGDRTAVERLVASLKDAEPIVRGRAAEALGRIGDARAAPDLARMVLAATPQATSTLAIRGDDPGSTTDPWVELRLGMLALARLKDVASAESVLLSGGKPRYDWWASTYAAMRVESPALKPVLLAAAGSNDPLSRAFAARGLGAQKDPSVVKTLAALTRDGDETVVVHALRALAVIADPGAAAALAALQPASETVTAEWLKALAVVPPDRNLRSRIVAFVGHEAPWIRAAALRALAHVGREDFALVLSTLDPDRDWSVRAGLARALGEAGDEVSVGILLSMLKDEDVRVLPVVLESLRKARGADAADTLKRHLGHADFAVRAAAADGLAALKTTGHSEALVASYRRSLSDPDIEARVSVVAALAVQKDARATEALRDAVQGDPARVVRERAAAALRTLGAEAPAPGPETVGRPGYDYREAMAPYDHESGAALYTPRVFIHTRRGRIEVHLNIVEAPLTSASFMDLARRGFYDGLTFHRVEPGFVIQGGSPRGDSEGGPGYSIRCEIGQRPYGRGTVGMALAGKDTGGSQFFITHLPTPHLDGGYTVFGWVASGIDVVDQIRPGDVVERVEVWDGR